MNPNNWGKIKIETHILGIVEYFLVNDFTGWETLKISLIRNALNLTCRSPFLELPPIKPP
jgi:hypothetical protein